MIKTIQVPTIEELKKGLPARSALAALLNTEPPAEWLKPHPTAKTEAGTPVVYLPIERIDMLLGSIYVASWTEVVAQELTPNSVVIVLRLFVINPETGRTEHYDGVGGASHNKSIESAAPLAESLAKKNAAKKLGKLFGRDLSRDFDTTLPPEVVGGEPTAPGKITITPANRIGAKARIMAQLKKSVSPRSVKACYGAYRERVKTGEIDGDDEQLLGMFAAKAEELGLKL